MAAHLMIHLTEAGTPGVGLPPTPGNAGEAQGISLNLFSWIQSCIISINTAVQAQCRHTRLHLRVNTHV
jgi:hypothetical protein